MGSLIEPGEARPTDWNQTHTALLISELREFMEGEGWLDKRPRYTDSQATMDLCLIKPLHLNVSPTGNKY